MPTQDQTSTGFGANEWMVEEMRAAWSADPSSVSPQWRELFETDPSAGLRRPSSTSSNGFANGSASSALGEPRRATITTQAASSQRRSSAVQDVTRSDLPPAPPSDTAPPTSPYAQRLAAHPAHDLEGDGCEDSSVRLKGAAARTAKNMDDSLSMPTATSARAVPAKVLIENRAVINSHLARTRGGKVSFTHLIGWAVVESLSEMPSMNVSYGVDETGKPVLNEPAHVAFGLAIDVPGADGQRRLLVPSIKQADLMDLSRFVEAYEGLVAKARQNKLDLDDFRGTTVTLTNPGMIGTLHSVPRLMPGQGLIVGVGSMDYPAAFAGASPDTLARQGIGKVVTLTSTYDHRVIQGAASGEFLRLVERKLLGLDGFWSRAFESLRIPLEPVEWVRDTTYDPELETGKPARVAELIHAFRQRGHLAADTDPLTYRLRRHPDLDITSYGLSLWDLDRSFPTRGLGGRDRATLREILKMLHDAYCRTVGVEYMHIQDPAQRTWWQERLERDWEDIGDEERRRILTKLEQAEAFETFLQTKYVGQKRFSLEGGESLIVALDRLLDAAAHDGLDEVVIGMAHRGRLNVLTNIAGKSYGQVFDEFEGNGVIEGAGTGDVKYHLGTVGVFSGTDGVSTRVSLAANPSHLETVDGVVEGIVRAKQDRIGLGEKGYTVMPVLVHGDAAFAGQGVVYETLNMSQLPAYRTGGTVHIIVNNQIGFTTGSASARSTIYATDLAKGLQVPIFHVNADDPETVARTARHAYEYRRTFHKDVIIDLICYRRRGHNEGDDPSMTQPLMYRLIDSLDSTRGVYTAALVGRGDITPEEAREIAENYQGELERIFTEARIQITGDGKGSRDPGEAAASGAAAQDLSDPTKVGVPLSSLEIPSSQLAGTGMMIGWTSAVARDVVERIGDAQVAWPGSFTVHPKLQAMLAKRREATREGGIDWGLGELIALGSLLMEGVPIRIAGEDARRATFAQRHAVLHDHVSGQEWTPLSFLTPDQAPLEIYDSLLSEYAAMGFEYGYSVARPDALVLWEAQFGDFANGAQIIADEFVVSGQAKWDQKSGVVLLLPHGFEGQGPDHSSARIERWLQLCAENALAVSQPSTAASYFHLLRQHAYVNYHRPVVVATPKSMLRSKAAASLPEEFTSGAWHPVLDDPTITDPSEVTRLLICSGKIRWELVTSREKFGLDGKVAIISLERLYPLPGAEMAKVLERYRHVTDIRFVQDEPANQGPWPFISVHLPNSVANHTDIPLRMHRVARPWSSAPSVGSMKVHQQQTTDLMNSAFGA